jgi:redox-sensitive bicupin YhaK (pirin superfamily)
VQVARGSVRVNDQLLQAGDGAAVSDAPQLGLEAQEAAEVLLFDLA